MKLFVDTGHVKDIEALAATGILDGVTTNPSLMARESGDARDILKQICRIVQGPVSAEVVATDAAGTVLGEGASRAITTLATSPGAAEQDADEILGAVHEAVIATVRQIPDHRVVVVAAAAQSGSVLPIGENDTRGRLVTWMDSRSARVVDRWSADDGAMIRRISGWSPSTGLGLSTIAWMREDAPTAFASVSRFAAADDLVTHHLTGEWSTNPTNASGMQLMEVATGHWSADLCRFAGASPSGSSATTAPSFSDGARRRGSSAA